MDELLDSGQNQGLEMDVTDILNEEVKNLIWNSKIFDTEWLGANING